LPSASEQPDASAFTASGAIPEVGVMTSAATGGRFTCGATVTDAVSTAVAPSASATSTLAVQAPAG
jgi:hypothetical protein